MKFLHYHKFEGHEGLLVKIIIALVGIIVIISFIFYLISGNVYVAGKYGTICYVEGEENGNIKYLIEFDNIDSCLKHVSTNQKA